VLFFCFLRGFLLTAAGLEGKIREIQGRNVRCEYLPPAEYVRRISDLFFAAASAAAGNPTKIRIAKPINRRFLCPRKNR
jgi:hypothetical protein